MLTDKARIFNIREFLSHERFETAEQIRFNWQCFGDNGKLYYDNEPVWKRFPKPMADVNKYDWAGPYPVNMTLKSAIRCTTQYANFIATGSPHYALTPAGNDAIVMSPSGHLRKPNKSVSFIDYEMAFIAHYRTMTISEYLHRRLNPRSLGNPTGVIHSPEIFLKQFCVENEMTSAKQKIWDDYILKVEREFPGVFDKKNQIEIKRPTLEELESLLKDVHDAILGIRKWTH